MTKDKLKPANLKTTVSQIQYGTAHEYLRTLGNHTIRDRELVGIARLMTHFTEDVSAFQHVYIGYAIPQLSKEFDLLIIDKQHHVINIELKSDFYYDEEKVKKQLVSNKHYLDQVVNHVQLFTYNSDMDVIYTLTEMNTLEKMSLSDHNRLRQSHFYQSIMNFKSISLGDIDQLLYPRVYGLSPFKDTAEFLAGNYQLTYAQKQVQDKMLTIQTPGVYVVKVTTGVDKTLMVYDTVKSLKPDATVLTVHIGQLNKAHNELKKHAGWDILPERQFLKKVKSDRMQYFDYIVIDEAEKLSVKHVNMLTKYFKQQNTIVFLIGDPNRNSIYSGKMDTFVIQKSNI